MSVETARRVWALIRDVFITLLGGCLLAYEALRNGGNGQIRVEAVGAYLLMLGLPSLVRLDKIIRGATKVAKEAVKEEEGSEDGSDGTQ